MLTLPARPAVLLLLSCLAVVFPVSADEDMDADLMRTIDDIAKSVTSNIDLHKPAAAHSDARELETLFKQVQAYFEAKHDAADGVEFARTSLDLAARIEQSLASQDFDAAARAAADLTRTCRSCHDVYKPL